MPGVVKNKTDLDTQIVEVIYPNTNNEIDAEEHQQLELDKNASTVNRITDKLLLNVRDYNTTRIYEVGEGAFYLGVLYRCIIQTTGGAWNPAQWAAPPSTSAFIMVKKTSAEWNALRDDDNTKIYFGFNTDTGRAQYWPGENADPYEWLQF